MLLWWTVTNSHSATYSTTYRSVGVAYLNTNVILLLQCLSVALMEYVFTRILVLKIGLNGGAGGGAAALFGWICVVRLYA